MGSSAEIGQGRRGSVPRPFPAITPQSYLPGSAAATGAGLYPGSIPPTGANQYPGMGPPTGPGLPPPPYNPMLPSMGGPPPISYPNMNRMQRRGPFHNPRFASYPRRHHRRPVAIYRRRRCRPIVRIIRSDSCSSISTCSTISTCSRRCHRSCSYSGEHSTFQQQQRPIIILPIQCQQPLQAITGPIQGQAQSFVLPSIQVQQQPISNISTTPIIIQPLNSMAIGQPQQIQAGAIQYVQAKPTSQLQFISAKPASSIAPQRVLVNSTNTKQSTVVNVSSQSVTRRNGP